MSHREVCVVLYSINERYGGGEMMEEITRNLSESTATISGCLYGHMDNSRNTRIPAHSRSTD